ncbi:MAG TPA: EVE domain-containing protein [Geobacteraceae bacterium]|nr:EVE domain-containing protein [Geobacteraceae bacterium]
MKDSRRYWLFKSEPSCFSFNDLENRPGRIEPWDGVRNYQARNFLRDEIRPGDGVLFYHSGIPRPAVVGTAVVVRGGYPDLTALDPESDGYDPRSTPDVPIWYRVDIRAEKPFAREVTLEEIRRHPLLADMVLLHRSRLSIQPVAEDAWKVILGLGGVVG